MHAVTTWAGYWSGVGNEAGKGYAFWSGIGSCLAYLGAIGGLWRHTNCHVKGCWRIGKHPVDGTPYKVCRAHHPALGAATTAEDVARAHAAAQDS